MMQYEEALENILKNAYPLSAEKVMIEESVGRILKEDIYSKIKMPPFDKAAMDGYAINVQDVKNVPIKLRNIGIIQAGDIFEEKLTKGDCVKIMTGAPLPPGTDSVVMIEDTRQFDDFVEILKVIKKGENVCFQGEDIGEGQKVIDQGTKISSSHVAVLATVGRRFVRMSGKPRVSILNTGGEIVQPGVKLSKNKIYNSNGPMLQALLKSDGVESCFLGIVKDNIEELKRVIKDGFKANILLISGGVSMGEYDLIPEVLVNMEVKKIFHKVNIKPGKPLFFGIKNKTLIFGIPGNPISNFLAYLIFIRPALYKMLGHSNFQPEFKTGLIDREFNTKTERKHFVLVKITKNKNHCYLTPIFSHGSADILALSKADGFMVVDGNISTIKKNSKIQFITWKII